MVFFILILLIVIMGYGVITQALLLPEAEIGWTLVRGVLYKPYFQMYGELFLDDENYGKFTELLQKLIFLMPKKLMEL